MMMPSSAESVQRPAGPGALGPNILAAPASCAGYEIPRFSSARSGPTTTRAASIFPLEDPWTDQRPFIPGDPHPRLPLHAPRPANSSPGLPSTPASHQPTIPTHPLPPKALGVYRLFPCRNSGRKG